MCNRQYNGVYINNNSGNTKGVSMFPNFTKLYKAINMVRKWHTERVWDFSLQTPDSSCFITHVSITDGAVDNGAFKHISLPVMNLLIPSTLNVQCRLYDNKSIGQVSKDEVCNMFERYTNFKVKQYHKWQQYEYRHFGKAVTDKRGVTI